MRDVSPQLIALQLQLPIVLQDSVRIHLWLTIADRYRSENIDEAQRYAGLALELSDKISYQRGIAKANFQLALCENQNGASSEHGDYLQTSLQISEEIGDFDQVVSCILLLASNSEGEQAEALIQRALTISETHQNFAGIASSNIWLGNNYFNRKSYEKALKYYQTAAKVSKNSGLKLEEANAIQNIGFVYKELKDFDRAIGHLQDALFLFQKQGSVSWIIHSYNSLGETYVDFQQPKEAIQAIEQSLAINQDINRRFLSDSYKVLSTAYEQLGNYESSNEYLRLFVATKDSLMKESISLQISELQTKYDTKNKEQDLFLANEKAKNQQLKLDQNTYLDCRFDCYFTIGSCHFVFAGWKNKIEGSSTKITCRTAVTSFANEPSFSIQLPYCYPILYLRTQRRKSTGLPGTICKTNATDSGKQQNGIH